ncbi:MAG: DUF5655 domain-containing protein [Actinomycetota bacterium]
MAKWTCPECGRPFGRVNQGHMCSPPMSLDDYFASAHEREQAIFEVINAHLEDLGPFDIDPVSVGILLKNGPVFAELRTKTKWVAVCFKLPVKLSSNRFSRKVVPSGGHGGSFYHVVNVADAAEIDDVLLDWLTEAYIAAEDR